MSKRERTNSRFAWSVRAQPVTPLPADDLVRSLKVARPEADESLPHIGLVGDTYTILLSGADTDGRYRLIDIHTSRPGGDPPPHRHDFEESCTILEGEIEATFRGEKSILHAGQTVSIPANAPHSFTNPSGQSARLLCICAPAEQEEFFAQVGVSVPTRRSTPPQLDQEAQAELMKKPQGFAPEYRTGASAAVGVVVSQKTQLRASPHRWRPPCHRSSTFLSKAKF